MTPIIRPGSCSVLPVWVRDWTFPQFAIVLLQTIVLYTLAGLVFADLFGYHVVDLKGKTFRPRSTCELLQQ
jgi:hypothetical protein